MLKTEFAEIKPNTIYEISEKIDRNISLNTEEKEIVVLSDAWVKEVTEKGDPDREIAAFLKRSINEEIYNAPDELLDSMFVRGNVGEFDDYEGIRDPKNTLIAHEAAKGGTVDRSWIDITVLRPTWKNRQIETDLSYVDIRRNGFKTVAIMNTFAVESFKNAMFYDIFGMVDSAIVGGDQLITESGPAPTQTSMDKLSLYLNDRAPQAGVAVTLTKYAQAIMRMQGYENYMSETMKDEFNRYGLSRFFDGVKIASISSAKRLGNGGLLIPDKKIFGIAGIVGNLDMKGEVRVYEDMDNSNELLKLKFADFTYGFMITDIDRVCKINIMG